MSRRFEPLNVAAWIPALAIFAILVTGCTYAPYTPPAPAFEGDSDKAAATVVVPTLDTPAPKGKNIIWCGTFKLAYDEWKSKFGPLNIPSAKECCSRLDAARLTAGDLPAGSYYVYAGKDPKKIVADMKRQFPHATPNVPKDGIIRIAYSYLAANVKFRNPYFDRRDGDEFVDSAGKKTPVSSFGLYWQSDSSSNDPLRRQIDVLFVGGEQYSPNEFALDLDKNSSPSQLILACVEPKETLAATWQDVKRKIDQSKSSEFTEDDHLAVPNVAYKIAHHFKEFETDPLMAAFQSVDFRLDKSGAALVSEAYIARGAIGRNFSFTRPFLIAMRKRGASEPYFVMWVDNAELLCRR